MTLAPMQRVPWQIHHNRMIRKLTIPHRPSYSTDETVREIFREEEDGSAMQIKVLCAAIEVQKLFVLMGATRKEKIREVSY
jgi:hypothetical protein